MTRKGKVLAASCLMYFLFYMDRVNISSLAPIIGRELHLSAFDLGMVFSAFAYPYAIFQIIGGYVGDRLGPKVTLGLCGLLVAAATIWTGLAGGLVSLICARILLGAAEGPAFPTATRALAAVMPAAERGFAQGITHSSSRLGNAVTPAVVAAMVAVSSWRASFITFGVCSLIWTLLWVAIYRADGAVDEPTSKPVSGEGEVAYLTVVKRVLPITLIDFCYGWVLWTYLNWTPLFLSHQFKLDLRQTAVFATGIFLAGVVGDTLGGLISDFLYRRYRSLGISRLGVIAAGFALSLVFIVPMAYTSDLVTAAILLSAAFFFLEIHRLSDLVAADGSDAVAIGDRERHHEFRFRNGRDHIAAGDRRPRGLDGELVACVLDIHRGPHIRTCGNARCRQANGAWRACRESGSRHIVVTSERA